MKRPAFQFYPADWRKDPALSSCSLASRGLWIEMICVMHESDEYGVLSINGNPMSDQQMARTVGENPSAVAKLIKELESSGVFSRREDGAIYSRRMIQDEHIRNVRSEAGKHGGNPNLLVQKKVETEQNGANLLKQTNKQITTPSSSSSSSVEKLSEAKASSAVRNKPAERFTEFWAAWPASDRKAAKGKCEQRWRNGVLDRFADQILSHIEASKITQKWISGYEPSPLRYLSERRWEDGEIVLPSYSERAIELVEKYNGTLFSKGWPEATIDVFSSDRSAAIELFFTFGTRKDWVDGYLCWLSENLEPRQGYGFDWVIKKETYIRAREGNFSALKDAA